MTGGPFLYHATLSPYHQRGAPHRARGGGARAWRRIRGRPRPAQRRRGLRAAGPRLARVRPRRLLATGCPSTGTANALGASAGAPDLLLDGRHGDELPAPRHRGHEAPGLCAPHQPADDHRQFRVASPASRRPRSRNGTSCVYADAYEWVELPNVHGMATFADGGLMSSKPYAGGGAYIDRMSDYCEGCLYSPKLKMRTEGVPLQLSVLGFPDPQRAPRCRTTIRLAMPYRTLAKWDDEASRPAIVAEAEGFLDGLQTGYPVTRHERRSGLRGGRAAPGLNRAGRRRRWPVERDKAFHGALALRGGHSGPGSRPGPPLGRTSRTSIDRPERTRAGRPA